MHVCLAIDRGGSPLIERSQHFVLTRFNVNIGPHRRTWDDAWLASRFRLFEEYCLPSMRSQTSQQFTWLIFFATSSRATIERYLADVPPMPNLQPVFTDSVFGPATTREAVVSRHDGVSDRLITTRLDCDDALRSDFVQRLQAVRPERPRGLQLSARLPGVARSLLPCLRPDERVLHPHRAVGRARRDDGTDGLWRPASEDHRPGSRASGRLETVVAASCPRPQPGEHHQRSAREQAQADEVLLQPAGDRDAGQP